MKWCATVCVAAGVVTVGSAGELPRSKVRPGFVCGLPDYDYRPANVTPKATLTAVSLPRVPAGADEGMAVQVFQLNEPRLRIDHCFLSRIAVTLYPDGRYQVSFRADQNPQPGADQRSPLRGNERIETLTDLQTSQLRRNLFTVQVRGYGVYPATVGRPVAAPGSPVLFELPIPSFWVQRGEPYSGLFEGRSESVRRVLPLTDRVEIDFTYR